MHRIPRRRAAQAGRARLWIILLTLTLGAPLAIALAAAHRMLHPEWEHHGLPCDEFSKRAFTYCGDPEKELALFYEDVQFPSARDAVTLRGWLVGAEPPAKAGVVFVHGGGGDRREGLRYLRFLHDRGFTVLLFDLRGHGASDGDGSGLHYGSLEQQDVRGAVDFMRARGYQRQGIIAGSMGAASTILASVDQPLVKALVLENTYTNMHDFVPDALGWAGLPTPLASLVRSILFSRRPELAQVDPLSQIHRLAPRPILLIAGDADHLTPVARMQQLLAAAGNPKDLWIIPKGDHGHLIEIDPDAYATRVGDFLLKNVAPQAPTPR